MGETSDYLEQYGVEGMTYCEKLGSYLPTHCQDCSQRNGCSEGMKEACPQWQPNQEQPD